MKKALKRIASLVLDRLPAPQHPSHQHQGMHLRWRAGWIKGWWYRFKFACARRLGGTRFQAGKRLSIQGKLVLKGPGRVVLGDDVIIDCKTDIYTHSAEAAVEVGRAVFLNGTRFGCVRSISIGEESIIADVRVMDSDYHSVRRDRNSKSAPIAVAPIRIERNVWIAGGSAVLKGVTIGEGSVVAFGSVVVKDVPAGVIAGGNPAKEISKVPE